MALSLIVSNVTTGSTGDQAAASLNPLITQFNATAAEALGFVKGTALGTEAATNRTAWTALLAAGGTAYFSAGVWDMRFASNPGGVIADIVIRGAGLKKTQWLCAGSIIYCDLISGSVDFEGIYADFGDTPMNNALGHWVGFANKTQNIEFVRIHNCNFRNIHVLLWQASGSTNAYRVDKLEITRNIVRNRNGLGRIHRGRFGFVLYEGNDIDCNIGVPFGGMSPGYGGIVHGYVQDNAPLDGLYAELVGRLHILNNTIRNIKAGVDPGSPGTYGIQSQSHTVLVMGNRVEKVYGVFGTSVTGEVIFTGDGVTTTFSGTLSGIDVIPDTLQVLRGGTVVVADDNDWGWARGGQPAKVGAGSVGDANGVSWGRSRQIVRGTGVEGWFDYNTKEWSLTFTTAPVNGIAYTVSYKNSGGTGNIESIYTKSMMARIIGNSVSDCGNEQGGIAIKGGGQMGYDDDVDFLGWEGGPHAQHLSSVMGNILRNRVRTTVFADSVAFWVGSDFITITGNVMEGMNDRLMRIGMILGGRGFIFANNIIKDFYGNSWVYTDTDAVGITISGNVCDNWIGSKNATQNLQLIRLNGATKSSKNVLIHGNTITDRVGAGKSVVGAFMNQSTGSNDVIIDGMKSLAPWYGFQKAGVGTGGRQRLMNHCLDQMTAVALLDAGASHVANRTDDGGFA